MGDPCYCVKEEQELIYVYRAVDNPLCNDAAVLVDGSADSYGLEANLLFLDKDRFCLW